MSAMNAQQQDVYLHHFSGGILMGVAAVTERPEDLRGWRLDDPPAHAAAAKVFGWLRERHCNKYNLRFRIILGGRWP